MAPLDSLAALNLGFRSRFLSYDEVQRQLFSWAEAFPAYVTVESLGKTPEGRDLWLLTVGRRDAGVQPTAWVDGNMHATELAGSTVALAIAEDVLALHLAPELALPQLPKPVKDALAHVTFRILPRMGPDGAEAVLRDGRYVRSNPRHRRRFPAAYFQGADVDGDGLCLLMRQEDPSGEFVEAPEAPGLMVPRTVEDAGPFYKVYPEGIIEGFDGQTIPSPHYLSDNDTDLNRNFPYFWKPEPEQKGAGPYATSEPETRAVVEFMVEHPEVFAWLNLHTFGGVFIRPLGHLPDSKMDSYDLAVFRQIEEWGETFTGYPTVSGFAEFTYEPDKPLHGDLTDFGYHQRGCLSYVCELWDIFRELGIPRKKPFVDHYSQMTREDRVALAKWDAAKNQGRIFRPWTKTNHPQLGSVEVGGFDTRIGLSNPPLERLELLCRQHSDAFLRVAAMAPRLQVDPPRVQPLGPGVCRIELTVRNVGYLPTYGLPSAKDLPWNRPLTAQARTEGCTLVAPHEGKQELGHLEGWGRGRFDDDSSIFFPRSRGSVSETRVAFHVQGEGHLDITVGGPRVGQREVRVVLSSEHPGPDATASERG